MNLLLWANGALGLLVLDDGSLWHPHASQGRPPSFNGKLPP